METAPRPYYTTKAGVESFASTFAAVAATTHTRWHYKSCKPLETPHPQDLTVTRPGVHIQPNTRTLCKHRGLLTPVNRTSRRLLLGNSRACVQEAPARNHPE